MSAVAEKVSEQVALFEHVERLERIADDLAERHDPAAADVRKVVADIVDDVPPVRIAVAVELLQVSKATVWSWLGRGIIRNANGNPTKVQVLDPHRLHEVLHIVRDLRELGTKSGDLAEHVWYRLEDQELAESDMFVEGMAAWRDGDTHKV